MKSDSGIRLDDLVNFFHKIKVCSVLFRKPSHDTKLWNQINLMNLIISLLIQVNQKWLLSTSNTDLILLLIVIHEPDLSTILKSKGISGTLIKGDPIDPVDFPVVGSHDRVAYELIIDHKLIVSLGSLFDLLKLIQDILIGDDLVHHVHIEHSQRSTHSSKDVEGSGIPWPDLKLLDLNSFLRTKHFSSNKLKS